MDLLPIGSDKILEVHTKNISLVIKSKKKQAFVDESLVMSQNSFVNVTAYDLERVKIERCDIDETYVDEKYVSKKVHPLFFEQSDYQVIIQSKDGKSVSFWHENPRIREKICPVLDEDQSLILGIVNFDNNVGHSKFEIMHDGKLHLILEIEVFPSKISYKEDYKMMIEDISNEVYGVVADFLGKTYEKVSVDRNSKSTPAMFFQIISHFFEKYKKAVKTIVASPHHKLYVEHQVMPSHKARKTDIRSEKWLVKHPGCVKHTVDSFLAEKVLAVQKRVTYDTIENQFAKFILTSTAKQLQDFKKRYCMNYENYDETVISNADYMISTLNHFVSTTFLSEVSEYKATQSMSLVFEMAPGYRELHKYYLILKHGLSINGDMFKLHMKDTAQLYEYWCFIKLVSIMKERKYKLAKNSDDIIKVNKTGVTVALVKGEESKITFINPRTGEEITLLYNPKSEKNSPTVSQKPDNVLTLQKIGAEREYKYVFDAKYRIETKPDKYYPDTNIGPKLDDINTMHRYRDAIVYNSGNEGEFVFKKEMFGAYVLFPYTDEEKYKEHHFYKSIDTVNIGGLPFLPGATRLVEEKLEELIADSAESAFERTTLPAGIEKRLAKVDWSVKDVLIGSVGSKEQFEDNIARRYYYFPEKNIDSVPVSVRYIALYKSGIKYYGEVEHAKRIRRKEIHFPMRRNNGEEWYYAFRIREWKTLKTPISFKDEYVYNKPRFTNLFLLENCTLSYELFEIHADDEFRLMYEIKRMLRDDSAEEQNRIEPIKHLENENAIYKHDGVFEILKEDGQPLFYPPIKVSEYLKHPSSYYRYIVSKFKEQNVQGDMR